MARICIRLCNHLSLPYIGIHVQHIITLVCMFVFMLMHNNVIVHRSYTLATVYCRRQVVLLEEMTQFIQGHLQQSLLLISLPYQLQSQRYTLLDRPDCTLTSVVAWMCILLRYQSKTHIHTATDVNIHIWC